ncbi:MAG: hypothetical protein HN737_01225 [Desulfobacterales bacterium]|jgi:sugar lactone lactonase YvrE|nr:hypothetical protein [Desulfobacteraceae bacterium]MBT4365352.1 hypothetical protein [Desulfobacteraceae bacterium]MBT7084740.1 hypothetical protein [Desulfobacterales bacterium]MBT7696013.1 hypothetical protein [Desulfobacterales bacterium]
MPETIVLVDRLGFPECPRWHNGRLFFSDMNTGWVIAVDLQGRTEEIVMVPGQPAGLGWLPDGKLLVVSMTDRCLMKMNPAGLFEFADLSTLASYHCNDMVVNSRGMAYVGNFGSDLNNINSLKPAEIIMIDPEGKAKVVADQLVFPNGAVITPDENTLIVAETFASRLTAFDILENGSLANRRVWAELKGTMPDGICLDEEGAIWVASPFEGKVIRIKEGGEITAQIQISNKPYACMFGGPGHNVLFILSSGSTYQSGRIETINLDISGAGYP